MGQEALLRRESEERERGSSMYIRRCIYGAACI
jgi:hypothetical protein